MKNDRPGMASNFRMLTTEKTLLLLYVEDISESLIVHSIVHNICKIFVCKMSPKSDTMLPNIYITTPLKASCLCPKATNPQIH